MTPEQIDRVFGRGRLKMVTGEHVEVFREAVAPGERRRYTKRFLNTPEGDFGQWTEREWRILARLIGHGITCVPEVVHFDRGRVDGAQIVQTFDAGVTVDQWATLLPVTRGGRVYRHVFEDCAHWWALAHHCLLALNAIHPLELVHLDIKGDNVCIPYAPASFDPDTSDLALRPVFGELALIDFAFALISRASLTTALPIGWQQDYDYQSPRLLAALEAGRSGDLKLTRDLDWRCDLYSLAAMLKRYLPNESAVLQPPLGAAWTPERYDAAKALILRIRELHDAELPAQRPHAELIELTGARVSDPELAHSLERGWSLARGVSGSPASASPLTPVTRLAPSMRVTRSGRSTAVTVVAPPVESVSRVSGDAPIPLHTEVLPLAARGRGRWIAIAALFAFAAVGAGLWWGVDRLQGGDESDDMVKAIAAAGDAESATQTAPAQQAIPESPPASAPAAESAPRESPAATPAPTAAQDVAGPPPSGTVDAKAQAALTTQSPAEPPAGLPAEGRGIQPRGSTSGAQKSSGAALPKQPSAPSRSAGKMARVPPIVAPAEPRTAQAVRRPAQATAPAAVSVPAPAPRVYAPWASLEPPAWARSNYRGKGPGLPPGANSVEASAKVGSSAEPSSLEATAAAAKSTRAAAAATEASRPQPSMVASAPAEPPRMPSVVTAPLAQPSTTVPATSSDRGAAPDAMQQQAARGVRPVAPIEERSVPARVASSEVAPIVVESRNRAVPVEQAAPVDFLAQGRRMLASDVPRVAARAEPQVARVLRLAAGAYYQADERLVAEATRAARVVDDTAFFMRPIFPGEARRLNDEARAMLVSRRNVMEAFEFQLRALGANPRDPEIAGNLASLYLKLTPSQPDVARQLALVALAGRDPQYHSSRLEDWFTFAVASALVGRESDATNALFVTLALTGDVDRRCVAAMTALANYGERLRRPVAAMYYRLHAQGRGIDSQPCAWPPNGSFMSRLQ